MKRNQATYRLTADYGPRWREFTVYWDGVPYRTVTGLKRARGLCAELRQRMR